MRAAGVRGRTLTLKLRLADFRILTRSTTLAEHFDDAPTLKKLGTELFLQSGVVGKKFRLLGLGLSHLDKEEGASHGNQLELPWAGEA